MTSPNPTPTQSAEDVARELAFMWYWKTTCPNGDSEYVKKLIAERGDEPYVAELASDVTKTLESRLAAYETSTSLSLKSGADDARECAYNIIPAILDALNVELHESVDRDEAEQVAERRIAAHTAKQTEKWRESLIHCVGMIQWMSGSNDFSPEGKAHQGWIKMFPGYEEARHLLAQSPTGATITEKGAGR